MKKIGLIAIALVVALGGLGAGYAMWTDTVTIDGPITTGVVKIGFTRLVGETKPGSGGDWEFSNWVATPGTISCPPGYTFTGIDVVPEDKDVGYAEFEVIDADEDGCNETLKVTIHDAYPWYLASISTHIINCGTIPIKLNGVQITQDPFLLIEWLESVDGLQIDPGVTKEFSFYVGVPQHMFIPGEGFVGDILPQNAGVGDPPQVPPLEFTITLQGVQWNEYEP